MFEILGLYGIPSEVTGAISSPWFKHPLGRPS